MKSSPPPPRSEWDFRSLLESQDDWRIKQCCDWEYFRELHNRCSAFRRAVKKWRKDHPLKPDGFFDEPFHPKLYLEGDKIGSLWFVSFPDWPSRPYLEAEVWNPNPKEPVDTQGHDLQVDLQEIIRFPPDLEWDHWDGISVLASSSSAVVALHLDWMRPLDEIREHFNRWLSWAHKKASHPEKQRLGKANPLTQAKDRLKWLTALRLLSGKRSYKEAVEIYDSTQATPEDPDLYSDQSGWIDAALKAEDRIKKLGEEWGVEVNNPSVQG